MSRSPCHPPPARATQPVSRQQSPATRPGKARSPLAGCRPRSPGACDQTLTSKPATWRGGAGARPPPAPSMRPGCGCSGRVPGRHRTLTPSPATATLEAAEPRDRGAKGEGREPTGEEELGKGGGKEHRKTCPVLYDVTSGWFGRVGLGFPPPQRGSGGGAPVPRGRSQGVGW